MTLAWIRFGLTALFCAAGLFMIFVSLLGVFKFKFDLNRMHAASLTDTLGLFLIIAGLVIAHDLSWATAKQLLIILIMWLSSPVASHMLSTLEILTAADLGKHIVIDEKEQEGE